MFSRLAQVTLVALGLAISNHADAAPLAYGTYYDETVAATCANNNSSCRANFSQLPADKLVMVGKINCAAVSSQPIEQTFFLVSATLGAPGLSRNLPIAVPPSQLIQSRYYTSWETNTHFLVGSGRFPYVQIFTEVGFGLSLVCTMIGDLVTPIQ